MSEAVGAAKGEPLADLSVVALGGGHGLAASLSALRRVVRQVCAVVTVADNGGSSGRLREEFSVLPPGDLRMALAALCGDDEWGRTWAALMQHRYAGDGPLGGHAVGNLLMVGLWDLLSDPVEGLTLVARLLGVDGRVLPMSLEPLDITARVRGADRTAPDEVTTVRGQAEIALTAGQVLSVALEPERPRACPEAIAAIEDADWVVLGPGSWYSSVIPHLLVPDLADALARTRARTVVTMNLSPQSGETDGYSPEDHLVALADHRPDLRIDAVLVDPSSVERRRSLKATAEAMGARVVVAPVAVGDGRPSHDPAALGRAYAGLFATT